MEGFGFTWLLPFPLRAFAVAIKGFRGGGGVIPRNGGYTLLRGHIVKSVSGKGLPSFGNGPVNE